MRALTFALVVLLGVLAWLLLRSDGENESVPNAVERSVSDSERESVPPPAPAVTPTRVDVEGPPKVESSDPLPPSAGGNKPTRPDTTTKTETTMIPIDGIVIVDDSKGTHHTGPDGSFEPIFRGDHSRRNGTSVPVAGGRFHVDCPSQCRLDIRHLVLDGTPARVEGVPFQGLEIREGVALTVRARWIDKVRLRVVDAVSRVDLREITIVRADGRFADDRIFPGDARPTDFVVKNGLSPLDLAPPDTGHEVQNRAAFWIGAAEHAWSRVEFDFANESERIVELDAAATLIVDLDGEIHEPTPNLRFRKPLDRHEMDEFFEEALASYEEASGSSFPGGVKPPLAEFQRTIEELRSSFGTGMEEGGQLLAEREAEIGEMRFDGMPACALLTSIEMGNRDTPLILCRAAATLVAGQTTRVSLLLAPLAQPEPVPLSGMLFVPAGWSTADLFMQVEPVDLPGTTSADKRQLYLNGMTMLAERPGWYRWNAGVVPPATYRFTVWEMGFSTTMAVAPPGLENVELLLPEAGRLAIRVVDADSEALVRIDGIAWQPIDEQSLPFFIPVSLEWKGDRSCYSATVPVGRGVVRVDDDNEWMPTEESAIREIRPGDQDLTIRVRHTCGVMLEFTCGGTMVTPDGDLGLGCKIESVGHDGRGTGSWISNRSGPSLGVSGPGRYRITIPAMPGFAPPDPVEIEIPAARYITHTVHLRRT